MTDEIEPLRRVTGLSARCPFCWIVVRDGNYVVTPCSQHEPDEEMERENRQRTDADTEESTQR